MSEWDLKQRFFARTVHLSFRQTFWRWIKSAEWERNIVQYEAVYPGDPRYDRAPYSAHAIHHTTPFTITHERR